MEFSLVLPCFNEEANIEHTALQALAWFREANIDGELIVTDDGSTDESPALLQQLTESDSRVVLVRHEENRGYGAAVTSGCDRASKKYIGFMDSDGQFRAEDFERLFSLLSKADVVAGYRARRADPFGRLVAARLYGLLVRIILGLRVRDINCAMKVFSKALWPLIRPEGDTGALFNAAVFLKLKRQGIPFVQVPVSHYPRRAGMQTGGSSKVIVRMVRELVVLRRQ